MVSIDPSSKWGADIQTNVCATRAQEKRELLNRFFYAAPQFLFVPLNIPFGDNSGHVQQVRYFKHSYFPTIAGGADIAFYVCDPLRRIPTTQAPCLG
jgi:hypothetical protein